jgi:hypothetical protein
MEAGWKPTTNLPLCNGICDGDVFWTMEEDRCVEEVGGIGGIDVEKKGNGIESLNEDTGSRGDGWEM